MTIIKEPKKISGTSLLYISRHIKSILGDPLSTIYVKLEPEYKCLTISAKNDIEIKEKGELLGLSGKLMFNYSGESYSIIKNSYGLISIPTNILKLIEYDKTEKWVIFYDTTIKGNILFCTEKYANGGESNE